MKTIPGAISVILIAGFAVLPTSGAREVAQVYEKAFIPLQAVEKDDLERVWREGGPDRIAIEEGIALLKEAARAQEADFPRAIGADDVVLQPEVSGDLLEWDVISAENIVRITRQGSREFVTVRDFVSLQDADGERFLRLRVKLAD